MRFSILPLLLLIPTTGCENVANKILTANAPAPPPVPHRCPACNGTGSITQSTQTNLPGAIANCALEATGFLGLGSGRIATVSVRNDGDVGGAFTFFVDGNYPGGGQIRHGEIAGVFIGPHATVAQRIRFNPQDGMTSVHCGAVSPVVVQQHQAICPACSGQGLVN